MTLSHLTFDRSFDRSTDGKEPLVARTVKSLPAMRETWVRSLCREDPLEKEMATHFSILAKRIPLTWGCKELDTTSDFTFTFHTTYLIL